MKELQIGHQIQKLLCYELKGCSAYDITKVTLADQSGNSRIFDMTPITLTASKPTAKPYFEAVTNAVSLLEAYFEARSTLPFEEDDPKAMQNVNEFAQAFGDQLLQQAQHLQEDEAKLIASFVKELDIYSAVRSCETFFADPISLQLLQISKERGWYVLFDHLAISAGSHTCQDARYVADYLIKHHEYTFADIPEQNSYQDEKKSIYPLYKQLDNGVMLRILVQESDTEDEITQYQNHTYGFTAPLLALRILKTGLHGPESLPLHEVYQELETVPLDRPFYEFSQNLFQCVFLPAHASAKIPESFEQMLNVIEPNLLTQLQKPPRLSIVSRKELPLEYKKSYFEHYGIIFNSHNYLHSAACYNFFLPLYRSDSDKVQEHVQG